MIKTIFSILVFSISFCSFSQSNYKEWNARNQINISATSESSESMSQALYKEVGISIDSVISVTNVIEINKKKYAFMNALVSRYFDIETMISINKSKLDNNINNRKEFLNKWQNKYAPIYGKNNVLIDSIGGYTKISNIPLKIYCAYITDRDEITDQWVYMPDTKNVSVLLLAPDMEKGIQKVLDRNVPTKIRAEFDETKPFFKPSIFKNDFSLLSTIELDKSLLYFIDACNEGNAEFELKMTHPKFLNIAMSDTGSRREIIKNGLMSSIFIIEKALSKSGIIEKKGQKYAKIVLSGGPKIDFSKQKNEGGMGMALGGMYMQMKSQFGEDNVILDKINWTITVINQELNLYAIYDSEIGGWQFSIIPFVPIKGEENNPLIKNALSPKQKFTSKYLDSLSESVDFIIPKEVLLKFN
jgi:hypothetical protein